MIGLRIKNSWELGLVSKSSQFSYLAGDVLQTRLMRLLARIDSIFRQFVTGDDL